MTGQTREFRVWEEEEEKGKGAIDGEGTISLAGKYLRRIFIHVPLLECFYDAFNLHHLFERCSITRRTTFSLNHTLTHNTNSLTHS